MTTLSAKADSFIKASAFKQRLLGLRRMHPSTLTSDGPVQADTLRITAFQVLRTGLPSAASELEVGKVRERRVGPESITLLTPTGKGSLPQKGAKRHSSVA